jgi:hypothetical protein
MVITVKAGFFYFALVFGVGFLLGTFRVVVATTYVGEFLAVLIELPIILAVAWAICRWLIKRLQVPRDWRSRLTMGSLAFGLLMAAELFLSAALFGNSLGDHLATYRSPPGALGLIGQLVFASFPLLQLRTWGPSP